MKKVLIAVLAISSLAGCSEEVLDWRNAEVSGGKVYVESANEPFTGYLTNIPESKLPFIPMHNDLMVVMNNALNTPSISRGHQLFGRHLICDIGVSEGLVGGPVSCADNRGAVRWESSLNGDQLDDDLTVYSGTGDVVIMESPINSDGQPHGIRDIYNPDTGEVLVQTPMKNGIIHGEVKTWDAAGNLIAIQPYENGKLNGVWKTWAPNGRLIHELPYRNGLVHGEGIDWDATTGKMVARVNFYEGERRGRFTTWEPDGTLITDVEYSADGTTSPINEGGSPGFDNQRTQVRQDSAPSSEDLDQCVLKWIDAFRKEVGEDAGVRADQLEEWEEWCADGQVP